MKKKRYLLVLAAALCLAGCGKENSSADQNADGGGQETYFENRKYSFRH